MLLWFIFRIIIPLFSWKSACSILLSINNTHKLKMHTFHPWLKCSNLWVKRWKRTDGADVTIKFPVFLLPWETSAQSWLHLCYNGQNPLVCSAFHLRACVCVCVFKVIFLPVYFWPTLGDLFRFCCWNLVITAGKAKFPWFPPRKSQVPSQIVLKHRTVWDIFNSH